MTQIAAGGTTEPEFDAVVVGAGFAGLYEMFCLRRAGFKVKGFEAGSGVGGTWYWNKYPGARVDAEVLFYSYSFSEELQQEWKWTERYATQPELLSYLNHVADRFDLRDGFQFGTRVTSATFDEVNNLWTVGTDSSQEVTCRYLIMASGCLSAPKAPEFPGAERFTEVYNTSSWPEEGVDVTGKSVAVIGTGSSGVQVIPVLAEQAARMTVFLRTAPFVFPAHNGPFDPAIEKDVRENYPELRQLARESPFGLPNLRISTVSALDVTEKERTEAFDNAMKAGHLAAPQVVFSDIITNLDANATAVSYLRDRVRGIVRDPAKAEILCLNDYPLGTKRPCLDTNFYETFNKDNVSLVNLRQSPIVEIDERGIRTAAGHEGFDIIVLATGFDAMTGPLTRVDIRGRGGMSLRDEWASGPRSFLGLQVAGFPNLFTVTGPGSPSVISNMLVSIEQHVEWVARCITDQRAGGFVAIEATSVAEVAWTEHVQEVARQTLYYRADSWYLGANVPGKPRVFMPYVGGVGLYRQMCTEIADLGYEGFIRTTANGTSESITVDSSAPAWRRIYQGQAVSI